MTSPAPRDNAPHPILAAALCLGLLSGCSSTTRIPPMEVLRLSATAPTASEVRWVQGMDGIPARIGSSYSLNLIPRWDLLPAWTPSPSALQSFKSPFLARLDGPMLVLQNEGEAPVAVPLVSLQEAQVREFSAGKTVAVALGSTAAGALVLTGLVMLINSFNGR
jgi:hypothetical protein